MMKIIIIILGNHKIIEIKKGKGVYNINNNNNNNNNNK